MWMGVGCPYPPVRDWYWPCIRPCFTTYSIAISSFKGAAHATASEAAQQPMDEDGVDNAQPGLVNRQLSIDESGWYYNIRKIHRYILLDSFSLGQKSTSLFGRFPVCLHLYYSVLQSISWCEIIHLYSSQFFFSAPGLALILNQPHHQARLSCFIA